jgi:hypothetical protein
VDKPDKKAHLKAWREQEGDVARARLPLDDTEMQALFDMLNKLLPQKGCDHTRRLTDGLLRERGHAMDPVYRWLDDNGGFCDCEVLANTEEAWRQATGKQ